LREAERIAAVERMGDFFCVSSDRRRTTGGKLWREFEIARGVGTQIRRVDVIFSGNAHQREEGAPFATRSRSPSEELHQTPTKRAEYCNIACNIYHTIVRLVLDTAAMVAAIRGDAGVAEPVAPFVAVATVSAIRTMTWCSKQP